MLVACKEEMTAILLLPPLPRSEITMHPCSETLSGYSQANVALNLNAQLFQVFEICLFLNKTKVQNFGALLLRYYPKNVDYLKNENHQIRVNNYQVTLKQSKQCLQV